MAAAGYIGGTQLLSWRKGFSTRSIQDRNVEVPPLDFENWKILANGFKLFRELSRDACFDPGGTLARRAGGPTLGRARACESASERARHGGKDIAANDALEGKFSVPSAYAMALTGRRVVYLDFTDEVMLDAQVLHRSPHVETGSGSKARRRTRRISTFTSRTARTCMAIRRRAWPSGQSALLGRDARQVRGLVEPKLGRSRSEQLFETARSFARTVEEPSERAAGRGSAERRERGLHDRTRRPINVPSRVC